MRNLIFRVFSSILITMLFIFGSNYLLHIDWDAYCEGCHFSVFMGCVFMSMGMLIAIIAWMIGGVTNDGK